MKETTGIGQSLVVFCIVALLSGVVVAQPNDKPLEATLLANSTAAQEGHELWLGVYVKLRPEWHIYWEYPGESGFATKVEWDLSEIGTTSSTTLFPIPSRFVGAGGVISYGYAGETLLMTRTTAVHLKPAAQKVTLRAKTRWLMCREDECRDGRETLEITLPVGTPQPANTELFERYERLVPQDSVPPNVKWNWLTKEGGIIVEIDVLPPSRGNLLAEDCAQGRGLAFFPLPPKGLLADIPEISGPTRKMLVGKDNQQITVFTGKATVKLPLKRTSRATTGALTLGGVLVQQPVEEDGTVGELVANRLLIPIP